MCLEAVCLQPCPLAYLLSDIISVHFHIIHIICVNYANVWYLEIAALLLPCVEVVKGASVCIRVEMVFSKPLKDKALFAK